MRMFQKSSVDMPDQTEHKSYSEDTVETVVGPSVHVEGDFSSEGNILVKGSVAGNVQTSKLLTVEEGAKITANVKAAEAVVSGEIQGNIKVSDKVELTHSARVSGDITCKVLSVEAGALVYGKIVMKGLEKPSKKKTASKTTTRKKVGSSQEEELAAAL